MLTNILKEEEYREVKNNKRKEKEMRRLYCINDSSQVVNLESNGLCSVHKHGKLIDEFGLYCLKVGAM